MGKKRKWYKSSFEDEFGGFELSSTNPKLFDKIKKAYDNAVKEIQEREETKNE